MAVHRDGVRGRGNRRDRVRRDRDRNSRRRRASAAGRDRGGLAPRQARRLAPLRSLSHRGIDLPARGRHRRVVDQHELGIDWSARGGRGHSNVPRVFPRPRHRRGARAAARDGRASSRIARKSKVTSMQPQSETPAVTSQSPGPSITTELAGRRTGMAFQRTRMAADRTLMATIRTSLSLIGFGFTIFQFFKKLQQGNLLPVDSGTARSFGFSLVVLGVVMLVLGIVYHASFMLQLRVQREEMRSAGLIHAQSGFPISLTLIVAVSLFLIGLLAVVGMVFDAGPLR